MWLTLRFSFEGAHALPYEEGPCKEVHGHSYQLFVTLARGIPKGRVFDTDSFRTIVEGRVIKKLHNHDLNEVVQEPNPENLALWIWQQLKGNLPGLWEIKLFETPEIYVTYRGEQNELWDTRSPC